MISRIPQRSRSYQITNGTPRLKLPPNFLFIFYFYFP
jgi:hypothetical protein